MAAPWLVVLAAAVPCAVLGAAPASARCDLEAGEHGKVAAVVDGETLTLEGGLTVRLVGAMAPQRPRGMPTDIRWEPSERSLAALTELAAGRLVRLFYGGRRRDRHGRALAHVFVAGGEGRAWLQGRLIGEGLALAWSLPDNRACIADLLDQEAAARRNGRGLWGSGTFTVADALDVDTLGWDEHRFRIVEGTVNTAAEVRGRVYLNFEADWRRDFTIAISARDRRAFERAGFDLLSLGSRHLRVRGWVDRRNGPAIQATHPEQIEVLD